MKYRPAEKSPYLPWYLITALEKSSDHVLNIINGNKMVLVMA